VKKRCQSAAAAKRPRGGARIFERNERKGALFSHFAKRVGIRKGLPEVSRQKTFAARPHSHFSFLLHIFFPMVLLIGRERVSTADAAHVASHAALRPAHAAFRAAGIVDFRAANAADSAENLVVLQRECGSALPGQFALVGSEDATTCHVVFVQRRRYRGGDVRGGGDGGGGGGGGEHTIAVAHLDDDEADRQMAIVMQLLDEPAEVQQNAPPHELPFASPPAWSFSLAEQSAAASMESSSVAAETLTEAVDEDDEVEFDVHIVGGYHDEEETSIKISNALLRYLVDSPHVFRVRLFFTGACKCSVTICYHIFPHFSPKSFNPSHCRPLPPPLRRGQYDTAPDAGAHAAPVDARRHDGHAHVARVCLPVGALVGARGASRALAGGLHAAVRAAARGASRRGSACR
jgi:hypothetical protein